MRGFAFISCSFGWSLVIVSVPFPPNIVSPDVFQTPLAKAVTVCMYSIGMEKTVRISADATIL